MMIDVHARVTVAKHICKLGAPNTNLFECVARVLLNTDRSLAPCAACVQRVTCQAGFDALSLGEAIHRVECALDEAGFAVAVPTLTALGQSMYADALNAQLHTDVTIHVVHDGSTTVFSAHACALAAASPYFETMLLNRTTNRGSARVGDPLILLDMMPPEAFGACMRFAYTGRLLGDMPATLVAAAVLAADMLELPGLVRLVESELLTEANAIAVIDAACTACDSVVNRPLIEACAARIASGALHPESSSARFAFGVEGTGLPREAIYAIAAAAVTSQRSGLTRRDSSLARDRLIRVGTAVIGWMRLPLSDLHTRLSNTAPLDPHTNLTVVIPLVLTTGGGESVFRIGLVKYVARVKAQCHSLVVTVALAPHEYDEPTPAPQLVTIRSADGAVGRVRVTRGMVAADEQLLHPVSCAEDGSIAVTVEADTMFSLCLTLAEHTFEDNMPRLFETLGSSLLKWLITATAATVDPLALLRGAVTRPTAHRDRTSIVEAVLHRAGGLAPGQLTQLLQQAPGLLQPPNEELLDLLVTHAIADGGFGDAERESLVMLYKCLSRGIRSASDADSHPKRQRTGPVLRSMNV
jgi:hypothetical protein